jgi:hypothetical protein
MRYREPVFEDGYDDETGVSGGRWVVEFPSGLQAIVPTWDTSADEPARRLAEWIATYPD